jgi:hypothetical protein
LRSDGILKVRRDLAEIWEIEHEDVPGSEAIQTHNRVFDVADDVPWVHGHVVRIVTVVVRAGRDGVERAA